MYVRVGSHMDENNEFLNVSAGNSMNLNVNLTIVLEGISSLQKLSTPS
jgi:hypothetical protein